MTSRQYCCYGYFICTYIPHTSSLPILWLHACIHTHSTHTLRHTDVTPSPPPAPPPRCTSLLFAHSPPPTPLYPLHPHYQYISVGFDLSDTDLKKLSERNVVNKGSTSYGVLPPYFVGYPSLCYAKTNQPTN